ncbi:diaminopropionate ammonia-lyase [Brevibacillus sp. SIMBA_040]|uniref:diaminopropionate ammonia-lyase n=2 Tax=Bacteria TaxID=2 RepID=UPI00397A812B
MEKVLWVTNTQSKRESLPSLALFAEKEVERVRRFHQSFLEYEPTPLRHLAHLSRTLGVGGVHVKDESYRFGLNAFKVLGGSYAIGSYIAKRLGVPIEQLPYDRLISQEVRAQLGELTFASATDGNHGRGVAWTARRLGQKSVIYMPKGSSQIRLENIRSAGAECSITEFNYDDAVRYTLQQANRYGWVVVQDTAWEGYVEVPTWIMQGYTTLVAESLEQLNAQGIEKPTHVFVQGGVGAYAGAVQAFLTAKFGGEAAPKVIVVEPNKADCLYRSALAGDGKLRVVTGEMDTIMAGLACGEPNPMAWEILWKYSDMFISCPDYVAADGMRLLGNPLGDDARVVSGESGAVTAGLLRAIMEDEQLSGIREALGLDHSSQVLLINTEGDTDPQGYRRVVWDGAYTRYKQEGCLHV